MASLFYSNKCKYCEQVIRKLQEHPELRAMVRLYNVDEGAVPPGVTHVPCILVGNEAVLGANVLKWLDYYAGDVELPPGLTSSMDYVSLEGGESRCGTGACSLMDVDVPRAAPMTPEHEAKMRQKVG